MPQFIGPPEGTYGFDPGMGQNIGALTQGLQQIIQAKKDADYRRAAEAEVTKGTMKKTMKYGPQGWEVGYETVEEEPSFIEQIMSGIKGDNDVPGIGAIRPKGFKYGGVDFEIPQTEKDFQSELDRESQKTRRIEETKIETKQKQKQEEKSQTTKEEVADTQSFLEDLETSMLELEQFDVNIGEKGFKGFVSRKKAGIASYLDELPQTKAFLVELKPKANAMARKIEGGRVTDQDRKIYADAFANAVKHPSETNIKIVQNKLRELKKKGGDVSGLVEFLSTSKSKVLQKMASIDATSRQGTNKIGRFIVEVE